MENLRRSEIDISIEGERGPATVRSSEVAGVTKGARGKTPRSKSGLLVSIRGGQNLSREVDGGRGNTRERGLRPYSGAEEEETYAWLPGEKRGRDLGGR